LLPSCGVEDATGQDDPWNEVARACFWDAYHARRQAEFASTRLTIEGGPITCAYRILGAGRVEVFIDQTQDRYSSGPWLRLDCSTLSAVDSTAPAPDFGPDDSCVETILRQAASADNDGHTDRSKAWAFRFFVHGRCTHVAPEPPRSVLSGVGGGGAPQELAPAGNAQE
jgi:hypothetical protein